MFYSSRSTTHYSKRPSWSDQCYFTPARDRASVQALAEARQARRSSEVRAQRASLPKLPRSVPPYFMITSLYITYVSAHKDSSSIMQDVKPVPIVVEDPAFKSKEPG